MEVLTRLREVGYRIEVNDDKIRCHWRGEGKPDPETVCPLLEELREHKAEALEALQEETGEPGPFPDPFDEDAYPSPGWIICLPDLDRPGWWIARRTRTLEPVGRGQSQAEAVLSLASKEAPEAR